MCGIFGFVGKPSIAKLKQIALATESRGPHAFGFSWITVDGRLRVYKQCGPISDNLGLLSIASDAIALIGHCRYTTRGSHADNINNHPHPCDGGWLVHNGTIFNHEELAYQYGLYPSSECDTEVLAQLIETMPSDHRMLRVKEAIDECQGPLAIAALWSRPARMILARRGKPLFEGRSGSAWYFASQPRYISHAQEVPDGKIFAKTLPRLPCVAA